MAIGSRRDDSKMLIYGGVLGVIALLLLVMLVVVIARGDRSGDSALSALSQAASTREQSTENDAWARRETEAIRRAQIARSMREGRPTMEDLVNSGELAKKVQLFEALGLQGGEWTARRVAGKSLYWVSWETESNGVTIGPRWLVQLDPQGPQPAGSGGVVAANALADLLSKANPDTLVRYLNRTDAVLDVLLKHKFEGGLPLSSSILVYFAGRNRRLDSSELIGWTVVPLRAEPNGVVIYDAFFQWRERGRLRVAHFQVDLSSTRFEARNLLANEIVAASAEMKAESVHDVRPRAINLNTSPSRESNTMVRALRYVLADTRQIEAVGALLSFRAQSANFTYDGWRIEPDGCVACSVRYRYREGGVQQVVSWDVDARGRLTPTSPISQMATRALSIAQPQDDSQQALNDDSRASETSAAQ